MSHAPPPYQWLAPAPPSVYWSIFLENIFSVHFKLLILLPDAVVGGEDSLVDQVGQVEPVEVMQPGTSFDN